VYDTTYTAVNNRVTSSTVKRSNGTVAGIVSTASLGSIMFLATPKTLILRQGIDNVTTTEAYIKSYELVMSKVVSTPLVVHTIPPPAILSQRRDNTITTRLPKAALWLLIVANTLFAIFRCVLATLAIRATDPEVHKVHVSLSTAGLAAQFFDAPHARQNGQRRHGIIPKTTKEVMFQPGKQVCLKPTVHGGAEFSTRDAGKSALVEVKSETLPLRQTHTL
jgi:hypothetical protein